MEEKVRAICADAIKGTISPDSFYDRITAVAGDTRTDDDLACILEDALMELEMEHGGPKGVMKKLIREAAELILEGLERK